MLSVLLDLAIKQAVRDGLGAFLDKTGVVQFGDGPPRLIAASAAPVTLTHRQPAATAGPGGSQFFVLMDDSTRRMWREACGR